MFEQLNEIPWKDLHHAYGTAEDIPDLLRALARPDQQDDALSELYGNIWHQGTVYEASSYAVTFLFELVADTAIAKRGEILGLIGALANGKSYLAVHGRSGNIFGDAVRRDPEFQCKLDREYQHVIRTRGEVFRHADVICRLLEDQAPMTRAAAAFVLSRFPEHVSKFGPCIREVLSHERDVLASSAMFWCLGAIGDDSPDARDQLSAALRDSSDLRQSYAAAVAMYRITGGLDPAAMPLYRQMAAATWFADDHLAGVPWDFREVDVEDVLSDVEPDPEGATESLLMMLKKTTGISDTCASIVHDVLEHNFPKGDWRGCPQLDNKQKEILRCLADTDAAWSDVSGLWFLIPNGATKISQITADDLQKVRDEMQSSF